MNLVLAKSWFQTAATFGSSEVRDLAGTTLPPIAYVMTSFPHCATSQASVYVKSLRSGTKWPAVRATCVIKPVVLFIELLLVYHTHMTFICVSLPPPWA